MAPEEAQSVEALAERFRTRDNGQDGFVLGAFDDELVGVVGCYREQGIKRRHVAVIWGMYVVPERRGRSIARRLLQDAIARAKEWPGVTTLRLSVVTEQDAARALYLSCGFQVFGLERRAMRVGDRYYDEAHMALDLD